MDFTVALYVNERANQFAVLIRSAEAPIVPYIDKGMAERGFVRSNHGQWLIEEEAESRQVVLSTIYRGWGYHQVAATSSTVLAEPVKPATPVVPTTTGAHRVVTWVNHDIKQFKTTVRRMNCPIFPHLDRHMKSQGFLVESRIDKITEDAARGHKRASRHDYLYTKGYVASPIQDADIWK